MSGLHLFGGITNVDLNHTTTHKNVRKIRKIYGKKSLMPFGRDSLFSILKNEVLNVSRRDIGDFLNAQGPIVHRRARPPKEEEP